MRVLQINASYKPAYIYGGPTMSVSKLSEQMVKAGHNLQVFTTAANGIAELPVTLNVPVNVDSVNVTYFKRLTKDHSHFSPGLLIRLWQDVKSFDIVHIHAWWNLVSVLSCLIALTRGVKVIISPRGTLSSYSFNHKNSLPKSLMHRFIGKKLLDNCYVHVTSPKEQQALNILINPRRFFDIPNFVQLPAYTHQGKQIDKTCFKLLFLSRIDEKKGLDILLNALASVSISYQLTVVGDGDTAYMECLKQIAQNHKIDQYITWLGFQHTGKFDLFKQHDLFILPSHDENFGNVVIESLSVGTAVLISDKVGLADYVKLHDLGWVFSLNELSLTNAINDAALQTDKLIHIHYKAPLQIQANFDEQQLTKRYTEMYDQILTHG